MSGKLISPKELQQGAKDMMLEGREPQSENDWILCANFWAANLAGDGLGELMLPIIGMIFSCPLSKRQLIDIAKFQDDERKSDGESNDRNQRPSVRRRRRPEA